MTNSLPDILEGLDALRSRHEQQLARGADTRIEVAKVITALSSFNDCVRYLNTRRRGALLSLDSESAVQDAVYLMLRPWIGDLVPENPTDKIANRFSIKDFLSRSNRLVIEAKYVRNSDHGKNIVRELNDDIETYRYHQYCCDLIFFIYDPDGLIPDTGALVQHICSDRLYGDKVLRCHAVIKP
jgi:hypothetical protein